MSQFIIHSNNRGMIQIIQRKWKSIIGGTDYKRDLRFSGGGLNKNDGRTEENL